MVVSVSATGAPQQRPIEDWLSDARRAESFGVIGAGYDNVAIQALIDAGYIWQPLPGKHAGRAVPVRPRRRVEAR